MACFVGWVNGISQNVIKESWKFFYPASVEDLNNKNVVNLLTATSGFIESFLIKTVQEAKTNKLAVPLLWSYHIKKYRNWDKLWWTLVTIVLPFLLCNTLNTGRVIAMRIKTFKKRNVCHVLRRQLIQSKNSSYNATCFVAGHLAFPTLSRKRLKFSIDDEIDFDEFVQQCRIWAIKNWSQSQDTFHQGRNAGHIFELLLEPMRIEFWGLYRHIRSFNPLPKL